MSSIDPKHVTVRTAGNVYYSNRARTVSTAPPTPEQLARRERDDWNKQVEVKKAAKRERKAP